MPSDPIVFVVDDDLGVRQFLSWLLSKEGFTVETFDSAVAFIESGIASSVGCLLLDIRMPKMSGLELQKWLLENSNTLPIIMMTGHGDIPLAVESMKLGAFDFFEKPFSNKKLLERVNDAISYSQENIQKNKSRSEVSNRLKQLTPRERQVHDLLVLGETNKIIAGHLEISDKTVEIHRSRVLKKMRARTVSDLIKWAQSK